MFDGWWACQGCLAKGPALNKRKRINPTQKYDEDAGNCDRHRHKRRRTDVEPEGGKNVDTND
eukprot:49754-Heterocapsa_arctica.AAC.1